MHFMGHDIQSWGEMYSHGAASCTVGLRLLQVLASAVLLQSLPARLFESACQTTAVCTSSSYNCSVYCIELRDPVGWWMRALLASSVNLLKWQTAAHLECVSWYDCCSKHDWLCRFYSRVVHVEGLLRACGCIGMIVLIDRPKSSPFELSNYWTQGGEQGNTLCLHLQLIECLYMHWFLCIHPSYCAGCGGTLLTILTGTIPSRFLRF